LGQAVPDATHDGDFILLELHPGTTSVAQAATRQSVANLPTGEFNTGGHAFNNSDQSRTVGFTGSQPTQHITNPAM
jgi:hypothetical protein